MWTNENRGRYDRSKLRYPSDLTDEEWALSEPLIPAGKRAATGGRWTYAESSNGLMYVFTPAPWRAIPKVLPPRSTVYDYFDSVGVGRHARPHPWGASGAAVRGLPRTNPTAAIIDGQGRQERGKGGSFDPRGYDAGKKIKDKKRPRSSGCARPPDSDRAFHDIQDRDGGALPMADLFGPSRSWLSSTPTEVPGAGFPEGDETHSGRVDLKMVKAIGPRRRLRHSARALDRRTHPRLAWPLPQTRQGSGMPRRRRWPSSASPPSASCCGSYAILHDVSGQTLSPTGC